MKSGITGLVRAEEWRQVRDFAVGAAETPMALAVVGEPGAGKSTLWRAGVAAAAQAGVRVLRSEPSAAESELPFAGLSDLLTPVLGEAGHDLPAPQREALEVALLLRPPAAQPPTAHAVGLAVLGVLRGAAATGPVLVAVDDVHWLDDASLDAVTFAVRRAGSGPIRLFVTARAETGADPLALAAPSPSQRWRAVLAAVSSTTIDLGSLSARQLRPLLPRSVSAAQARVVAKQSRGNPFWAQEIAASLQSEETPVPELARTLTDRLAVSLSDGASEALALVSAAGRITVSGALAVLDRDADGVSALDEAVVAGVVTETDGRLTPAHPLIGAAAVEALPPGRRQALYTRLAAAAASAEKYAHFAALAAGPHADEAVAEALDAAAEAAHSRAGNAEAAQFAVRAVDFTPADDADRRTHRLTRAAQLLFLAGDVTRSLELGDTVDPDRLSTADLEQHLPVLLDIIDLVQGAPAARERVATLVETMGPDPRRQALMLSLASDFAYGLHGGRRAAATEAIRAAEAAGPAADGSLHRALIHLVAAEMNAGEGLDESLLRRAERLEERITLSGLHDTADSHRGWQSRYVDDFDTSRAALLRGVERAREAGDDFTLAGFLSYLAATEESAGDYAAAAAAIAASGAAGDYHDWPLLPFRTEPRCDLLIAQGDLDGALALAARGLPDAPSRPAFLGALVRGRVSAWRGDHAEALRWFERGAVCADECEFLDPGVRQGLDTWLAEEYVSADRLDEARRIAAWLREIGDRMHRPTLVGNAFRIEALALAREGDLASAAASAQSAVAEHEQSPVRFELVRSLLTLGRVERRRRARRQARSALRRARTLALEIGHRPLIALVEQELPRVATVRSGPELTATERRVADLVATGATNRETAAALFVSPRTVETHVASIFRKLGVRNRSELSRRYPVNR